MVRGTWRLNPDVGMMNSRPVNDTESIGASRWHVLHVRARCEKKFVDYAAAKGLEVYLPLRVRTRVYQRRRVSTELPVFPGYVFAAYAPDQRMLVLQSNVIANILEVEHECEFLRDLEQIRAALAVDETLGACQAFTTGRRVRIVEGPFAGVEGRVESALNGARVVLNVEMIGQGVAVEVEMDYLEPAAE